MMHEGGRSSGVDSSRFLLGRLQGEEGERLRADYARNPEAFKRREPKLYDLLRGIEKAEEDKALSPKA